MVFWTCNSGKCQMLYYTFWLITNGVKVGAISNGLFRNFLFPMSRGLTCCINPQPGGPGDFLSRLSSSSPWYASIKLQGSSGQWYGHVQRMEEGKLPKEVIKWCPPGRRKRGRPKLTWAEGSRGLLGEKD